jgi:hypothetical protein
MTHNINDFPLLPPFYDGEVPFFLRPIIVAVTVGI